MPQIHLDTNVGQSLEALVDSNGLQAVVDALAAICYEKADHIQTNWQDAGLARLWLAAGRQLGRTAETTAVVNLRVQLEGK